MRSNALHSVRHLVSRLIYLHLHFGSGLEGLIQCPWLSQSRNRAAARLLGGASLIRWARNMTARASPRMFWLVIRDEHLEANRSLEQIK